MPDCLWSKYLEICWNTFCEPTSKLESIFVELYYKLLNPPQVDSLAPICSILYWKINRIKNPPTLLFPPTRVPHQRNKKKESHRQVEGLCALPSVSKLSRIEGLLLLLLEWFITWHVNSALASSFVLVKEKRWKTPEKQKNHNQSTWVGLFVVVVVQRAMGRERADRGGDGPFLIINWTEPGALPHFGWSSIHRAAAPAVDWLWPEWRSWFGFDLSKNSWGLVFFFSWFVCLLRGRRLLSLKQGVFPHLSGFE